MDRDPAAGGPLNALLNFKGFHALQAHRAAHALVDSAMPLALWLQSRASQVFGVDIHPSARLGEGLMLDHGTGVVIGATAVTGPNCSFLHGVTLGATGKDGAGDRHPKLGANVLIGCGASILGNIRIGDNAKIGSGSVVLRPIPPGATAVGIPARIIGGKPPPPPSENGGGKGGANDAGRATLAGAMPAVQLSILPLTALHVCLDALRLAGFISHAIVLLPFLGPLVVSPRFTFVVVFFCCWFCFFHDERLCLSLCVPPCLCLFVFPRVIVRVRVRLSCFVSAHHALLARFAGAELPSWGGPILSCSPRLW